MGSKPIEISPRRRPTATDITNREGDYIEWLSRNHVPVVLKLTDGEEVRGWIEYYDRDIVRLTRDREPNLFIYKNRLKYLYEEPSTRRRR